MVHTFNPGTRGRGRGILNEASLVYVVPGKPELHSKTLPETTDNDKVLTGQKIKT